MADQLLRCKPASRGGETVLDIEALAGRGKWRHVATIRPEIRFAARDTLNLDIFTSRLVWQESAASRTCVVASGSDGSTRLVTEVSVHSHDMLRVETRVTFRRTMRVEMVRDQMTLEQFPADHVWAPHQTPLHEMVIGDFAFRAPAVIVQSKDQCLAVIPNLRFLEGNREVPTALSVQREQATIAYGCVPYRLLHHTYFAHYDTDTADIAGVVKYSYFISFQKGCKPREGMRRTAHRLWRLYAETEAVSTAPQTAPYETFAGIAAQHDCPPGMREAYGMALRAKRTKDKALLTRATEAKEALIALPQKDGLFVLPGAIGPEGKEKLVRLADLSWACYWLVRWHKDIEQDASALAFARALADRVATLQKHGGHVPAWVEPGSGSSHRFCARSAESAAHTILMAALHQIEPTMRYLSCARRAVNFAIRELVPTGRWENTEAFCTTSPVWKGKKPLHTDPVQGGYASHVLALWTVAEALIRLFEATRYHRYLSWGERVLDELSLYQQLWDPPFIAVPCFGGFGAMNTDIQWNDAAQALIAKTYLDYYRACGLIEYCRRGTAALRTAWSMLRCAENAKIEAVCAASGADAPNPGALVPWVAPANPGAPRTEPGSVSSSGITALSLLCVAEVVKREYGDLYVDARRNRAFGINGVQVERVQQDLAGFAVFGREALGLDRTIVVRPEGGQPFTVKVKAGAAFEVQA